MPICKACQESRHRMCEDPENCECTKAVAARNSDPDHLKRLEVSRGHKDPIHIRLVGLTQKPKENPTSLHISIEEGGTLTNLEGKILWSGFVSVESFEETLKTYQGAICQS